MTEEELEEKSEFEQARKTLLKLIKPMVKSAQAIFDDETNHYYVDVCHDFCEEVYVAKHYVSVLADVIYGLEQTILNSKYIPKEEDDNG